MTQIRTALVIAVLALLAVPAVAAASTPGLYRTDRQAARYLDRTSRGPAFCLNGYYSRHEQRTGRHFPQRSDQRFRSFTCTSSHGRLYLVTRPHGGWHVQRDR